MFRQHHSAFDVAKVCRHHQKFTSEIDVQHFERLDEGHVLLRDFLDPNVVNVEFVLFDEIKKEIKRSLENLHLNFKLMLHRRRRDSSGFGARFFFDDDTGES